MDNQKLPAPITAENVMAEAYNSLPIVKFTVKCDHYCEQQARSMYRKAQKQHKFNSYLRLLLNQFSANPLPFATFDGNMVWFNGSFIIATEEPKTQRALRNTYCFCQMYSDFNEGDIQEFIDTYVRTLVKDFTLIPTMPVSIKFIRTVTIKIVIMLDPKFGLLDYVDFISQKTKEYVDVASLASVPVLADDKINCITNTIITLLNNKETSKGTLAPLTVITGWDKEKFDGLCIWFAKTLFGPRFVQKILKQPAQVEVLETNAVTFVERFIRELFSTEITTTNKSLPLRPQPILLGMSPDTLTGLGEPFVFEPNIVVPTDGPIVNPYMPSMTNAKVLVPTFVGKMPMSTPICSGSTASWDADEIKNVKKALNVISDYSPKELTNERNVPTLIEDKFNGNIGNITVRDDLGNFDKDIFQKMINGDPVEYSNEYFGKQNYLSEGTFTILTHTGSNVSAELKSAEINFNVTSLSTRIPGDRLPFAPDSPLSTDEKLTVLTLMSIWGLALMLNKSLAVDAINDNQHEILKNPLEEFLETCFTKEENGVTTRDTFFAMYMEYFTAYSGCELSAKDSPKFYAANKLTISAFRRDKPAIKEEINNGYAIDSEKEKWSFVTGYKIKPALEVQTIIAKVAAERTQKESNQAKLQCNPISFCLYLEKITKYVAGTLKQCCR